VSDHLARCTIRQELAAILVASLVLSHQYSNQRRRERHTWVPLAVVGLVHVVATLIHCLICDLFGLLILELLICRCIIVELQDDRLDVMADRRQRFKYMYIYIVVRWQWISGQGLASSFLSAQPTAKSTQ
jgi:hypothetical protein